MKMNVVGEVVIAAVIICSDKVTSAGGRLSTVIACEVGCLLRKLCPGERSHRIANTARTRNTYERSLRSQLSCEDDLDITSSLFMSKRVTSLLSRGQAVNLLQESPRSAVGEEEETEEEKKHGSSLRIALKEECCLQYHEAAPVKEQLLLCQPSS